MLQCTIKQIFPVIVHYFAECCGKKIHANIKSLPTSTCPSPFENFLDPPMDNRLFKVINKLEDCVGGGGDNGVFIPFVKSK
jgi:hypothetical protein